MSLVLRLFSLLLVLLPVALIQWRASASSRIEIHHFPAGTLKKREKVLSKDWVWEVPAGWELGAAQSMRLATYRIPTEGGVIELSVSELPGPAGGLLSNVNRWRGQIGLKPLDSLAGQIKTVAAPAGEVRLVDFTGSQDKRIAGAVLTDGSGSLFFKLTGSKAAVAAAKPAFLAFVRSLRRGRP